MKTSNEMPLLVQLTLYIITRRFFAENKDIATTAGKKNSVEHALVSSGMKIAYSDILDWLSAHGVKV